MKESGMAEHNVGQAGSLLQDGQMKRLKVEDQEIVLARVEGQYYAFGGNCTHYGAPLDEGVLKDHCVICPWHHATFDIRSGLRLEPPALNDLPHFPVRIDGGNVLVTLPQANESEPQGKADPADPRVFVIVGGGAAGNAAAEELRRSGFKGRIVILSAVPNVPVDRPNLSKDYLAGKAEPGWIPLRGDASWYAARDIELRLSTRVTKVDPKAHTVSTHDGQTIHYDKLLLATGGVPRSLGNTPGADLGGIYMLRALHDADRIIEAAQAGKRAVVIGTSFIGMEVAASLAGGRGVSVTVVGMDPVPFLNVLGDDIGRMLRTEHEANGVTFQLNSIVARFTGENGQVKAVELRNGKTLPADFVVIGVGVVPATDFLFDSGLALDDKDRSVKVDIHLRTSDPDIYAAGDIARWADGSERGKRIEHWRVAEQQGMVAARNMLGQMEAYSGHVPFFWTNQWSVILDYVGNAEKWDRIIYRGGKPADKKFLAFYMSKDEPLAVAGSGYDQELDAIEIILRDKLPLTAAQIQDESFDLIGYAKQGQ
jgi:NADPH-dependent 2,4-dienoyl-CoA reductase/sulfur reductase-like enzyme/nitrite reductase/ring-hydroxylating ferredoxin subunit